MNDHQDPRERREAFQRNQLRERLRAAAGARQENYHRQDHREQRRREDQRQRESNRMAEREKARNFSREMAGQRRADKVEDESARFSYGLEEQQEITRREELLQRLGAVLYKQKLQDDYEHDARTRDLDAQEYTLRSDIDTGRLINVDNNAARNSRREIREHLKAALYEKLADHYLSEHAKRSAADQELYRMAAESSYRTTEIREESAAQEREMWTENEVKKDYEKFMVSLRRDTDSMTFQDIADVMKDIRANE